MSQEGLRTGAEVAADTIEVIEPEKTETEAAEKLAKEKAAAEKRAAEEAIAAQKAHIEAVAKKFSFSINADTLARLLADRERSLSQRLSRRLGAKLEEDPARFKASVYREKTVGVKKHIDPVTITNIGTMNNELKIVEGNSTRQASDDLTLFLDEDTVQATLLDRKNFKTDRRIGFIGKDPELSLGERLEKQARELQEALEKAQSEEALRKSGVQPKLTPLLEDNTEEVTGIRKIGDLIGAGTADVLLNLEVPPKSA